MKASETRQKAREFLKTLSGKYQLFLVSIILAILTISISYTETYRINGTTVNATVSVPGIVSILSALFLASASYAVLDVIRHKRDHVEVGDNMLVFSNEIFGKYVVTAIVKWVFLFLWSLIGIVGSIIFVVGVTATTSNNSNGGTFVTIIGFVLMGAGFALSIIKQYSYGTSYCNNTVYTYDADGRMVSSLMTTEGEDYNVATELKYNENGDTLEVIELTTVDASTNVSQKYRYVYDENGKLREKYVYATEDEIGYEYLNIGVEKYDADGNKVEWMTYTCDDYENYKVAKSFSGSAEEEFNDMIARFKMTCGMHLIYKYKEIEMASSLIDRIKAFFNFS